MRSNLSGLMRDPFTIRQATSDDIPAMLPLGRMFYAESTVSRFVEWDDDSATATLAYLIDSQDGILLVVCRKGVICGFAGGLVYPFYFNRTHRTGQEMFWYVEPEHRDGAGDALFAALEGAATAKGAVTWTMVALDALRPEAVGAIYQRKGYEPSERCYIRKLA